MNDSEDIRKAWSYIEAYKLPAALTAAERDEWTVIVEMMSKADFDRARQGARSRPADRHRFRPTTEEFWGFLEPDPATTRPASENGPTAPWKGHGYEPLSLSAREYGFAYIQKIREAQGWKAPA